MQEKERDALSQRCANAEELAQRFAQLEIAYKALMSVKDEKDRLSERAEGLESELQKKTAECAALQRNIQSTSENLEQVGNGSSGELYSLMFRRSVTTGSSKTSPRRSWPRYASSSSDWNARRRTFSRRSRTVGVETSVTGAASICSFRD